MRTSVSAGEARAVAFRRGQRGVEPRQRPRADAQDQFVHVVDEIEHRAIGDADFGRQFPAFQPAETLCRNRLFRRCDQVLQLFCSSFQWS